MYSYVFCWFFCFKQTLFLFLRIIYISKDEMKIKYKIKKLAVKLLRPMPKSIGLSKIQQKAYDTTMQILSDKESDLSVGPISGKKIIKRKFINEDGKNEHIFITINRNNLHVINGIYHYDIYIDDKMGEYITKKFNAKLEKKISAMENEIKSNVIKGLEIVISKVDKSRINKT